MNEIRENIKDLAMGLGHDSQKILFETNVHNLIKTLKQLQQNIDEVLFLVEQEIKPKTLTEEMQASYHCPDEGCPGMVTMGECSHCGENYHDIA